MALGVYCRTVWLVKTSGGAATVKGWHDSLGQWFSDWSLREKHPKAQMTGSVPTSQPLIF